MAFTETQKLNQIWLKVLYGMTTGISMAIAIVEVSKSDSNEGLVGLAATLLILIGVYFLVFESVAETRIDSVGISYKYVPIIWNFKTIPWSEIERIELKKISPISDYGGWGFRFGRKGRGIILAEQAIVIHRKKKKPFILSSNQLEKARKEIEHYQPDMLK